MLKIFFIQLLLNTLETEKPGYFLKFAIYNYGPRHVPCSTPNNLRSSSNISNFKVPYSLEFYSPLISKESINMNYNTEQIILTKL